MAFVVNWWVAEVGEGGAFALEGREEDGTLEGIEGAVEEEMCARLGFAAAGAQEFSGFEVRLVASEIASAGPKLCEECQLVT